MEWTVTNEQDIGRVAQYVVDYVSNHASRQHAYIVALVGDLGAGKTTFTQHLARKLGIQELVTSPTFVIQKKYSVAGHGTITTMVHIDAYRLHDASETQPLSFQEELMNKGNLIVIEWADLIQEVIPQDALWLSFEHIKEGERLVRTGDTIGHND